MPNLEYQTCGCKTHSSLNLLLVITLSRLWKQKLRTQLGLGLLYSNRGNWCISCCCINGLSNPVSSCTEFKDLLTDVSNFLSFFQRFKFLICISLQIKRFHVGVNDECVWLEENPPTIKSVIILESSN